MPPITLSNSSEGLHNHWQLGESVEGFVKRVPPLTTPQTICDWIWVQNPFRANSDSSYANVGDFLCRGTQLLQRSQQTRNEIETKGPWKAQSTVSRMLNQESKLLQQRISDLAVDTKVLSGKVKLLSLCYGLF